MHFSSISLSFCLFDLWFFLNFRPPFDDRQSAMLWLIPFRRQKKIPAASPGPVVISVAAAGIAGNHIPLVVPDRILLITVMAALAAAIPAPARKRLMTAIRAILFGQIHLLIPRPNLRIIRSHIADRAHLKNTSTNFASAENTAMTPMIKTGNRHVTFGYSY